MTHTQKELLELQTSVEENGNNSKSNSELLEREKIENTPFYIIGNKEQGYFITLGKYRLTEQGQTKEDLLKQLDQNKWDIIMKMIITMSNIIEEKKLETI